MLDEMVKVSEAPTTANSEQLELIRFYLNRR